MQRLLKTFKRNFLEIRLLLLLLCSQVISTRYTRVKLKQTVITVSFNKRRPPKKVKRHVQHMKTCKTNPFDETSLESLFVVILTNLEKCVRRSTYNRINSTVQTPPRESSKRASERIVDSLNLHFKRARHSAISATGTKNLDRKMKNWKSSKLCAPTFVKILFSFFFVLPPRVPSAS